MDNLMQRLLKIVEEQADGKHTVFAKKAGILPATFQNYINGRSPNAESLFNICITYNVNLNWLLAGKGEPYIKEGDLKPQGTEDDPEISELLEGARKVLRSDNKVAHEALEAGIRYISQTIDDLENMKETKKRQKNMELRMASLETRLKKSEEIRSEDSPEQQEDILKLRTTG